jgi:hypothetical protein
MIKWIIRSYKNWLAKKEDDVPKYLGRK